MSKDARVRRSSLVAMRGPLVALVRPSPRSLLCCALTAVVLLGAAARASATTYTWTGDGDGTTWSQDANWMPQSGAPAGYPGDSVDTAIIGSTHDNITYDSVDDSGGGPLGEIETTSVYEGTLTLDGGTVDILNLEEGTVALTAGSTLDVGGVSTPGIFDGGAPIEAGAGSTVAFPDGGTLSPERPLPALSVSDGTLTLGSQVTVTSLQVGALASIRHEGLSEACWVWFLGAGRRELLGRWLLARCGGGVAAGGVRRARLRAASARPAAHSSSGCAAR